MIETGHVGHGLQRHGNHVPMVVGCLFMAAAGDGDRIARRPHRLVGVGQDIGEDLHRLADPAVRAVGLQADPLVLTQESRKR